MRLKKLLILLVVLLAAAANLRAQNNTYGIDDELYQIYLDTYACVKKDDFKAKNEAFREACVRKGDLKAETISYYIATADMMWRATDDGQMKECVEECCQKARETGYMQYYYSAMINLASYYFNKSTDEGNMMSMNIAKDTYKEAADEGNEYGQYTFLRYLAEMYTTSKDTRNGRALYLKALDMYANTSDPTLKRQSACPTYLALAKTYDFGSDSLKLYLGKAMDAAKTRNDSLTVAYHKALECAVERDFAQYDKYKDYSLVTNNSSLRSTGTDPFRVADAARIGDWKTVVDVLDHAKNIFTTDFVCSIAESYGRSDIMVKALEHKIKTMSDLYNSARIKSMEELEVSMGNSSLQSELLVKSQKLNSAFRLTIIIAIVSLLAIIVSLIGFRIRDRRMIEQLQVANERVVKADGEKTAFVQNMSHEIRTPLNAIVGFSQLLGLPSDMVSDQEREQYSKYVIDNSSILTMLIDDILNASDFETGRYKIEKTLVSCNSIVASSMKTVEYRVPPGVRMYSTSDFDDDFMIFTDPRRVQQILINYLTNACKHTDKGSIHVDCSSSENPGCVTFSVADTGTGVPAGQAERIFERFVKLNNFKQGSGLGLNICRTMSEKLGGRVSLDTNYKEGARFVFVLPIEKKA